MLMNIALARRACLAVFTLILAANVSAQDVWQPGPLTADLGNATLKLDQDWAFMDGDTFRQMSQQTGDPVTGTERGLVVPADPAKDYAIHLNFEDMGYVPDDDADELDPDAIYESYEEGVKEQNEDLAARGLPTYTLMGWRTEPHYDAASNRMEWCLIAEMQGEKLVNHEIRLLGREGVMSATIVATPETVDSALAETHRMLGGFSFKEGKRYADYESGDKIAQYGLAALVTGGALAVAAKSGLLGKLIKPLLVGGAVVIGLFAKFFKKIFGGFAKEA